MMEHTLEDQGYFRTVETLMVWRWVQQHHAQAGGMRGFALRFPRILPHPDGQAVSEIDTVERVRRSTSRGGQAGGDIGWIYSLSL